MAPNRTLPSPREQRLIAGVIGHLPLFAGVAAADTAAIAQRSWTVYAARGDVIVRRHARLPGTFAVAYGTVKLVLQGPEGEERVLRLVGAGQTFGEASSLAGRAADYEALAITECKLVVLPTAPMLEVAERQPGLARNLMMVLAQRVLQMSRELQAATLQRGSQRLAAYLLSLAGEDAVQPTRIVLPVTKTMVASRLGVKKETLSRLLRQFTDHGLIEVRGREIALREADRLAAMARVLVDLDQIGDPAAADHSANVAKGD